MGMDAKTCEKIFEPFFTTKGRDKGSGLGLSIVYGIVSQHNGVIMCSSEPGAGTTFSIYLPVAETVENEKKPESQEYCDLRGSETILLGEDDEQLRDLTRSILEDNGYCVIVAEDGQSAIDSFRKSKDEISLVLLDLVMPDLNGKEAYDEILKISPTVPAIFFSGYAHEIIKERIVSFDDTTSFLSKPITADCLLRSIRTVLFTHYSEN
jgi:CheY-like chemotaxis protein